MRERTDFRKLIAELEAAGVSMYKIATMMHRQYIQVQRWKEGAEPRHHEGEMLREIHREFVKEPPMLCLRIVGARTVCA